MGPVQRGTGRERGVREIGTNNTTKPIFVVVFSIFLMLSLRRCDDSFLDARCSCSNETQNHQVAFLARHTVQQKV